MILLNPIFLRDDYKIKDIPSEYLNQNFTEEDESKWAVIAKSSRYAGLPLVDRSGTLKHKINLQIINPMPALISSNDSFETVAMQRANELIAKDKIIDLYWSGGIDSTVALVAFLKANIPTNKIHVHLNQASINEYPLFYNNYITNLPHTVHEYEHMQSAISLDPDRIIVNGELGDQIFGSDNIFKYQFSDLNQPYQQFFHEDLITATSGIIQNSSVAIVTLFDYLWYMNFCCKWQYVKTRFSLPSNSPQDWNAKIYPFFETFEQWSLNNRDKCIEDTFASYKWPAKEFIHSFTGDSDYLENKLKVGSLRIKHHITWDALENDGTIVTF